ncbi:MAG: DUF2953 domain-containing protein [Oscillospiraceae bacterium]|nr:DUF2953 domain-containing protein [Oscillospiraceae bacterium]
MVGLYVVAGIFAALVLALCVRVCLLVRYDETLRSVKLSWLFLRFTLYPKKEKPQKPKKPKEKSTEKKKDKPKGKTNLLKPYTDKEGISGVLFLLQQTADALGGTLRGLRKGLCIHNLQVYAGITAESGDAAETAILYGRACAVIYSLVGGIITAVRTYRYDVDVNPDYLARKSRAELYTTVSLRSIRILWELILLAARLLLRVGLPIFKASKQQEAEHKENGEAT